MEEVGTVTVFQDRSWSGDPLLGAFVLSVDGRRAGVVGVQESLTVGVPPGYHRVRIRHWWYKSGVVELDLSADRAVRMRADIDRSKGAFWGWMRFMFTPWKALMLAPTN
jgi:hypothetical protein